MNDDKLSLPLDRADCDVAYAVQRIEYPDIAADWPQRLEELGFLPGEREMLMARAAPGGDPLAVRVGHSTYALRRQEAACVQVKPLRQEDA